MILKAGVCPRNERKNTMKKNAFVTMLLLVLSTAIASAAPNSPVPFKLTDSGDLAFTSQTTANLAGTGIATHGGKGISAGTIAIVGNGTCQGGMLAKIEGAFTAANGDLIKYTVNQQLCPTAQSMIYVGVGSFTITGGTGRFVNAKGAGSFSGLGDFSGFKYQCSLDGTISY
jgi:hypothetical protein